MNEEEKRFICSLKEIYSLIEKSKNGLSEKDLSSFKKYNCYIDTEIYDLPTFDDSEMYFGEEVVKSFEDSIQKIWDAIESFYIYAEYFYDEERFVSFIKLIDILEEMVLYMIRKKEG